MSDKKIYSPMIAGTGAIFRGEGGDFSSWSMDVQRIAISLYGAIRVLTRPIYRVAILDVRSIICTLSVFSNAFPRTFLYGFFRMLSVQ
jgi:hypothetical protein